MRSMRASNARPANSRVPFFFQGRNAESGTRLLHLEPLARDARQARALELGEPALERELLHRGLRGLLDEACDVLSANLRVFDQAPQVLHQRVHQGAALRGVEAVGRRLQVLRREAVAGEGAERACRLVGEHLGAAADLFCPDGGRDAILQASPAFL
jgi:hypothetical protein